MPNGFSLISINGEISKPATVLINRISDVIGGYLKPRQIRRVAAAEADADIIKAKSEIQVTGLQRRALARFISEEAKKQENIESIIEKSIPELAATSNPQDMDDDWIMNFFDKCRIISDIEMQFLWAKVLASEANNPNTYSKRTVNLLGSLAKSDAVLFTELCRFMFMAKGPHPLIFDVKASIYIENHIVFDSLTHLGNIGLITFNSISGYAITNLPQEVVIGYFAKTLKLRFNKTEENSLKVGTMLLSQSGIELSRVCHSEPVDGFFDYVIEKITEQGITCINE